MGTRVRGVSAKVQVKGCAARTLKNALLAGLIFLKVIHLSNKSNFKSFQRKLPKFGSLEP